MPTPDELRARVEATELYRVLGVTLDDLGAQRARASVEVAERHCNLDGVLQGGVSALVADLALGCAARTGQRAGSENKTLELEVDFHAPVHRGECLIADAIVVAQTGRLTWVEAELQREFQGEITVVGRARSLNAESTPP